MNLHQLRTQLSQTRYTLLIAAVMLLMIYFGYQLAMVNEYLLERSLEQSQTTLQNLSNENERVVKQKNELAAQLEIAEITKENLERKLQEGLERESRLKEQMAFYQKVISPEISKDGFTIDSIQIAPTASDDVLQLSMILVQQIRLKAVINGELIVSIHGSLAGEPYTLHLNNQYEKANSPLLYRFKYFQIVDTTFSVPNGFIPEKMFVETGIRQYKRFKGTYKQEFDIFLADENEWQIEPLGFTQVN
ncbi:DUF6776 family protein [Alteromonas facilis]|uniref:DUF6776 family protein n=1 Tax=Alteromonas facilis TaxID=2048004 RepID=UPI000C2878EB|nr:DUF6776 family protein [Alteromonas facilis]